jgi:hypothetical protein
VLSVENAHLGCRKPDSEFGIGFLGECEKKTVLKLRQPPADVKVLIGKERFIPKGYLCYRLCQFDSHSLPPFVFNGLKLIEPVTLRFKRRSANRDESSSLWCALWLK